MGICNPPPELLGSLIQDPKMADLIKVVAAAGDLSAPTSILMSDRDYERLMGQPPATPSKDGARWWVFGGDKCDLG